MIRSILDIFERWDIKKFPHSSSFLYEGNGEIIFYDFRSKEKIGIVGKDGKIKVLISREAVKHVYKNFKMVRRVLIRKDLRPGERLATKEEIDGFVVDDKNRDILINL